MEWFITSYGTTKDAPNWCANDSCSTRRTRTSTSDVHVEVSLCTLRCFWIEKVMSFHPHPQASREATVCARGSFQRISGCATQLAKTKTLSFDRERRESEDNVSICVSLLSQESREPTFVVWGGNQDVKLFRRTS